LSVLECPSCGAPVSGRQKSCPYCGATFVVQSLGALRSQPAGALRRYAALYRDATNKEQIGTEVEVALGIVQLRQKLFPAAVRTFERLLEKTPERAELYLYYCVSLIGGRPIRKLPLTEAKRMLELARSGAEIAEDPGALCFLILLIRRLYFERNGVSVPAGETNEDLIEIVQNSPFAEREVPDLAAVMELNPDNDRVIATVLDSLCPPEAPFESIRI
jgi:transposase-like protein